MQIVKFLQNKMGLGGDDGVSGLAIDINGQPFTKDQLIEARRVRMDELARERDPEKRDELACLLAQLESAIKAFEPIAEIKAQAERRREELHKIDMATLAVGQQQFQEECDVIASMIMKRAGDRAEDYMYSDGQGSWQRRFRQLVNAIYASLTFEQATIQFDEICDASREGNRPWKELVPLPTYTYVYGQKAKVEWPGQGVFDRAAKLLARAS